MPAMLFAAGRISPFLLHEILNIDEREMLDVAVSAMSGLLFADKGLISADFSWPGAVSI
jgi:hypothetical protein